MPLDPPSTIAVIEMLSVLRKMSEHCGPEFQVTSKTIKQVLKDRFGVSFAYKGTGRDLFRHVVDTLIKSKVFTIWDQRLRNKSSLVIYQVNITLLHNT